MKKLFVLILLMFLSVLVLLSFTEETYAYTNPINELYGLGYSVDAGDGMYADPLSVRIGAPIFDETWLSNLTLNSIAVNQTTTNVISSYSFRGVSKEFSTSAGSYVALNGSYDLFTFGMARGFGMNLEAIYESYYSQYFYYKTMDVKRFSLALPNYSSNIAMYKQNLHPDFVANLTKLSNGQLSYSEFYNIYGTHVIANAVYGGRLEMFYSVLSNQKEFTTSVQGEIFNQLELGIIGFGSASSSADFSVNQVNGLSEIGSTFLYKGVAIGGIPFDSAYQDEFSTRYSTWLSSIVDNEVLIGYGNNGLIPLYYFVPDHLSNVGYGLSMEMNSYLSSKTQQYANIFESGEAFGNTYATAEKTLRTQEFLITDSGRFNQPYDLIDFANTYGIDLQVMRLLGYNSVDVIIKLNVREVHDGYQYIFLYDGDSNSANLLGSRMFEHGGSKKNTNWQIHSFAFSGIPLTVNLQQMVIRYGASGSFSDDWINKDLKVQFVFRK
ncbi:MAG: MACPF domain-containing protein [Tenericutes bacterium]|nr:MACPF domain-containing protein [Mycoplasmatota bacterium]